MLLLALLVAATPAQDVTPASHPENLLRGPARCALRYLEAVRLAGPRAAEVVRARPSPARPAEWAAVRRLIAPRALDEIARAGDEVHPLAPWRETGARVLERFQLLAVRRAPLGSAVVTAREVWWAPADPDAPLAPVVSEYLVARVDGAWRVVARRPAGAFADEEVASRYAGWFDGPDDRLPAAGGASPAHGAAPGDVPR